MFVWSLKISVSFVLLAKSLWNYYYYYLHCFVLPKEFSCKNMAHCNFLCHLTLFRSVVLFLLAILTLLQVFPIEIAVCIKQCSSQKHFEWLIRHQIHYSNEVQSIQWINETFHSGRNLFFVEYDSLQLKQSASFSVYDLIDFSNCFVIIMKFLLICKSAI